MKSMKLMTITREFTREQLIKHINDRQQVRHDLLTYENVLSDFREYLYKELAVAEIALVSLADESGRNPVLAYADSYRDMAKQGVESIPVWSVITDLERNIAPLYTAPPVSVVPDEMLCAFYEVDNWPDLVRELVKHVEQLQDSAQRNVKPWEDTFPETLLPAYIERIKRADDVCRAAMPQSKSANMGGLNHANDK